MPETANLLEVAGGARRDVRAAAFVAGACLVAFALRAWALWHRGVVSYDETYYYILGTNLLAGRGYTLNGLPHTAFPPLYPVLVGLAGLLARGISQATSSVSAVVGALLPVPIYFLARDVHGRRAGCAAAAAAAVWPALFFFAAGEVPYANRVYAGSEPLYVTLFAAGMLFIWRTARQGGWANACLAGVFFGLASLARSEGAPVFVFLFVWLVVDQAVTGRLFHWKAAARTLVVGAVALAVFSPFLVYLHWVTGRWGLGAKLGNKVAVREAFWDWVERDDARPFIQIHYRLNDEGTEMEDSYWGVSEWHRQRLAERNGLSAGASALENPDWRWLPIFLRIFHKGRYALIPPMALVVIGAGLVTGPWDRRRWRWWGFVAANFTPMALMAVMLSVLARNELPLVALFAVAAGKGLDALASAIERLGAFGGIRRRFAAALALLPAALFLWYMADRGIALNAAGARAAETRPDVARQNNERKFAEVIADVLPPHASLAVHRPWIAVWAGARWRVTPLSSGDRFLHYVKSRGIEFALLEVWQPELKENGAALEPYLVGKYEYGEKYYLYDFRPAGQDGGSDSPGPAPGGNEP